jgi:hypothetical protein
MAKPVVVLVGADKGGVGKTTVSRTILDYLAARKIPTRAFDTEWPRGTLKRFHPDITEVVDVTSVSDQMKIFDTLETSSAAVTLIDVRAGIMSSTLNALRNIGFLDAGRKGQLTFALFHILGSSIASLDEIAETSHYLTDAKYFLVKDAVEITIPQLSEMAYEQVELVAAPFTNFIANKAANGLPASHSFVLRGYVRHWLENVWSEFDRVKFLDLVGVREGAAAEATKPRLMKLAEAAAS